MLIQAEKNKWGWMFPGTTESMLMNLDCNYNGMPVCCSALSNRSHALHSELTEHDIHVLRSRGHCIKSKVYHPSPYEIRHYKKSVELRGILDFSERKDQLVDFLASEREVLSVMVWLDRVRMRNNFSYLEPSVDDFEYLSYFNITQKCHGGKNMKTWLEWIEPLSMHGRHPQSFYRSEELASPIVNTYLKLGIEVPNISILDPDYLIVQRSDHMHNYEMNGHGRMYRNMKYMFDAGASRFDSSMRFFTCMYAQKGIDFDQLLGWEYTPLEPKDFWSKVPPRWKHAYNFFNTPISGDNTSSSHPFQVMLSMGIRESDFVSFKLDVDTPEVELPIVLDLLKNKEFSNLVDEFFFEIHFRCELMMKIGWGDKMPESFEDLKLDRVGVLELFSDLRKNGVRSHFWV
eukprot:gene254-469_t